MFFVVVTVTDEINKGDTFDMFIQLFLHGSLSLISVWRLFSNIFENHCILIESKT